MTADQPADPDESPRVAVVGGGYWGGNLVRVFSELGALRAVSDADSARAVELAAEFGVTAQTLDEVLDDPQIEGVVIAAPASAHAELARKVLLAGKHAFVEKPLALQVNEAHELCVLAEEVGRLLMVGHLMQYHPAFTRLTELVHGGHLGRVNYVYSNRLNFGRFRREENILWSFAPHDISMILTLIGSEPVEVSAVGATYLHRVIADVTTTHLRFPGGEQAHVFVSWLHPFKEQKLVVVGDRGMAVLDDGQPWETKLVRYDHQVDWRRGVPTPAVAEGAAIELDQEEPLRAECAHFLECMTTKTKPRTDGWEGLRVLRVLQAAERAMENAVDTGQARPPARRTGIHETAWIDEDVEIGAGTRIWHFSHVQSGSRVGRDCTIGQNVSIGPNVTVGDNCKIQNNVSLYEGVTLADGVFCGPSAVFTNVTTPRAEVDRRGEFAATPVGRGATIGANATIVCGHSLGEYCLIAAGSVVTKDVPPHALVMGVPARQVGWVSHAGERLGEDLTCPRTGQKYREVNGRLEEVT